MQKIALMEALYEGIRVRLSAAVVHGPCSMYFYYSVIRYDAIAVRIS